MSETQNKELAKSYDPASIEAKWYPFWEKQGYFKAALQKASPLSLSSCLRRTLPVSFIWVTPSTTV